DAERAIKIVKEYLSRVIGQGGDELSWDSDSLYSVPASQQKRILALRRLMKELIKEDSSGFTKSELKDKAKDAGLTDDQIETIWEQMRKDGDFYQTGKRSGESLYKLTHAL
ncbi:MAG: hypothetical protein KAX31_06320, partial [Thermoplasmata archaeon]|nr:hypothetical protein [Thermoplasmata archaeon]